MTYRQPVVDLVLLVRVTALTLQHSVKPAAIITPSMYITTMSCSTKNVQHCSNVSNEAAKSAKM